MVQPITQRDGHPDLLAEREVLDLIAAMDGGTVLRLLDTIEALRAQLAARDDVRVGLHMAARLIEEYQPGYSTVGGESSVIMRPRLEGNMDGLAYAKAIRALSPDPTPAASEREAVLTTAAREALDACRLGQWALVDGLLAAAMSPPAPASDAGTRVDAGQREGNERVCAVCRRDMRETCPFANWAGCPHQGTPPSGGDAAEVDHG